ncbi:MAG: sulfatase-like hydrolase/transferase [Terriglobia bacterium]|jgi:arylsulfatase A-like enzyme/Tfp pilus assembly protein PilF
MTRYVLVWAVAWSVTLFVGAGNSLSAAAEKPPSIVVISVDTLRADHLSCYGYRRITTPHLDALARGGTLFSAVSSQVPLTFPSHVSLFTSTYPFFNGIEDNGEALRPHALTLSTVLKAHGYHTGAVVGGFVLDRRFGLDQGFDWYDSTFDLHRQADSDTGDVKRLGAEVVASANKWLETGSGSPFFLFVHLYDLHTPYNLPASYRARFGTGYDAELRYVDEQVGVLLESLRQHDVFANSLIVLTSDHGEGLGEHGEKTHGYFIYQSTIWVPLVTHWPAGGAKFPARIDEPAGLVDVAPTILQFAGITPPPEFQGRSLLDLVRAEHPKVPREVASESIYAERHFGCSPLWSLRAGRYKYIQAPKPELYDLAADPGETRNLFAVQGARAQASKERLEALRARFRNPRPRGHGTLDPETIARLGSLGYVAGSSHEPDPSERGPDPKDRIGDFEEFGRAIVLASIGHIEESNALLERLLTSHPDLLDVRMSLGLNDQRLRRQDEAAREFQQVLKADPLNAKAHLDLGLSFFEMRKLDEAAREFQAALVIAPNYTRAEDMLGSVALQRNDYARARERFEHVLTVDPNDYSAHYNLGALAALQGQWDASERHLRAALSADPLDPDAHNTLGSLYLRKGDLDRAAAEFRETLRLRPKSASTHYNLGLVLSQQHRAADAAEEFRQALAIDPQLSAAREALGRLRGAN